MNRNLVNDFIAADAALHDASARAFLALEAEHAAELARIEAKADAAIAAVLERVAALETKLAEAQSK